MSTPFVLVLLPAAGLIHSAPRFEEEVDGGPGRGGEEAVHLREGAGALALAARREVVTGRDREVAQAREHWRGAAVLELAAVFFVGAVAAGGAERFRCCRARGARPRGRRRPGARPRGW